MQVQQTAESFLNALRRSGLIDKERLKTLLDEIAPAAADPHDPRKIADALVAHGAITAWQADKLLEGRHKGFFLGKYKILSHLGSGGMSSVYLAEHVLMRRRVAIKVLPKTRLQDSSYLQRFHREAQAVAKLDHPNIVRAHDVDQEANLHFLVMEYVEGQSLQEMVRDRGPLPYTEAAEYIRQAAEGLQHAMEAGLVHRDIKPANLLVTARGVVKILDMGLARFFDDTEEFSLTRQYDENVLGTADYLAPEQALDSHSVDTRADIYGLGCTLYYALTGHPPFPEGTLAQRLMSHQSRDPKPVADQRPDAPRELIAILRRMMAKKPAARFQQPREVVDALSKWLAAQGKSAHTPDESATRPGDSGVAKAAPPAADHTRQAASPPTDAGDDRHADDAELAQFLRHLEKQPNSSEPPRPAAAVGAPPGSPPSAPTPRIPGPGSQDRYKPIAPSKSGGRSEPRSLPRSPAASRIEGSGRPALAPRPSAPDASTGSASQPLGPAAPPPPSLQPEDHNVAAFLASLSATPQSGVSERSPPTATQGVLPTGALPIAEQPLAPHSQAIPLGQGAALEPAQASARPADGTPPDASPLTPAGRQRPPAEQSPAKVRSAVALPTFAAPSTASPDQHSSETCLQPELPPVPAGSLRATSARKRGMPVVLVAAGLLAAAALVIAVAVLGGSSRDRDQNASGRPSRHAQSHQEETDGQADTPQGSRFVIYQVRQEGDLGPFECRTINDALDAIAATSRDDARHVTAFISIADSAVYAERIQLDGRDFHASVQINNIGGSSPTLRLPEGDAGPLIRLNGVAGFTLMNVNLDAAGADAALEIVGDCPALELDNLRITGFRQAGLVGVAARGNAQGDAEIAIENVRFEPAQDATDAAGIWFPPIESGDGGQVARITIRGCRFLGALQTGLRVQIGAEQLVVRESIFAHGGGSAATTGILFDAPSAVWRDVVLLNNTFYQLQRALAFTTMPASQSSGLAIHNNLFAELRGPAGVVETGYDPARMTSEVFSTVSGGATHNWDTRGPAPAATPGDLALSANPEGQGGPVEFLSRDASSPDFLVPVAGSSVASGARTAGLPEHAGTNVPGYIGALAPR